MKFILTLLLLTLFADASYMRAIRVTSFLDKDRAEKGLIKLKNFVKEHKNLKNLEEKLHFEYTIHKIDKHYLIVLEPLTDKVAVQEILNTLRIKYKKAYPRKLEAKPITSQKIEKKALQPVSELEFLPEQTEIRVVQVVPKPKIKQIEPKVVPAQKVKSIPTPIKKLLEEKASPVLHDNNSKIRDNSEINSSDDDISTLLIFILALLLIISFFYIYFSRKKRKKTHSKTLTEIVIDSQDELKLKEQKAPITFEDDKVTTESTPPNKEAQTLMSNKLHIKHEELNTKVGLNFYNNELITYHNALKGFKEKHLNSAIVIEQLCNNSDFDFDEALTLVRVLKEESIQIGAFNLHESIKTMEQEMELGENSQWEKSIWAYGITLQNLSTEIDHYLS